MMIFMIQTFCLVFLCLIGVAVSAQDQEVVTLGDTITGNQEQPKVLYIVPWKQTKDDTILSQGLESRLSDVFDHVERSEHTRELEFFDSLVESTSDNTEQ